MALHFPPLDCSHQFADLINFHIEKNPTFPAFAYLNENAPDTLTEISLLEFGRAAHRVAHALRPSRQGKEGEVVMLIANTDTLLHHAVLSGLSVAGWIPFPVSPRNSGPAIVSMMNKTNCTRIVTLDHAHKGLVDAVRRELNGSQLIVYEVPTLHHTFPSLGHEVAADPFVPYPPSLDRPNLDSPALYIHSSGSTGFPKPIAHSHRLQIEWMTRSFARDCAALPSPRRIAAMSLPALHTFGLVIGLYGPIGSLSTTVVFAPRTENTPHAQPVIPTSDNLIEVLKKVECNMFLTVPAFLEQMATSDEAIQVLKQINLVTFGGGPLPVKSGDKLWSAGVKLCSGYGATEFGSPVAITAKGDITDGDWMWMRFLDPWNIRWVPQGDDTYELQFLRTEGLELAVENLTDTRGYATSDVFVKHPTKDAWRVVGRADDVITLASGEKTVPAPMESIIGSSPLVQGVVMFGRERNQVGVLIEPRQGHTIDTSDEKALAEFRNQIWPVVEDANKSSPAFSRIFKEMILVTKVDKPMMRATKGTVQRKVTLKAYEAEIDALYDTVEASATGPDNLTAPLAWTSDVLGEWLLEHARAINEDRDIDPGADLFAQGFDSLSVTYLRNRIVGALRKSPDPEIKKTATHIPSNIVFANPTIVQLASSIAALVRDGAAGQVVDIVDQHKKAIHAMIEKYSVGFDCPVDGVLPSSHAIEPAVVLITGTTGGLGSFLLSELLKSQAVERIFAFNRWSSSKSIEQRQKAAFSDRGLAIDLLDLPKLVYVEADASQDRCGLSPEQYGEIRNSVTVIIHNAWRLDFNLAISSFEDSIRASRNFVDLGLGSRHKEHLRFLFTSSIGSAQGWKNADGPFPEKVQLDPSVAIGAGYGEGKYATERIIVKSGLHVTSLRIGQIAGGHGGSWATTDWFPIIVKSSVALGVLPESAGVVSWLREEEVAVAILETAFSKDAPPPVLNIVNPQSAPWAEIVAFVRRAIIQRKALGSEDDSQILPIVPFGEWFSLLEKKAEDASEDDLVNIPGIKLLEFFRVLARGDQAVRALSGAVRTEAGGMTNFGTSEAQRVSPTMANMRAIGKVEADAWVGYWMSKGAL